MQKTSLAEVEKGAQKNPNLDIEITDYFGSRDEIAEILLKTALNIQLTIRYLPLKPTIQGMDLNTTVPQYICSYAFFGKV